MSNKQRVIAAVAALMVLAVWAATIVANPQPVPTETICGQKGL